MSPNRLHVAALIFPGFNILDLTGPSEVLGNSFMPEPKPRILVVSATENTRSAEGITVKRDLSFIELLAQQADGTSELANFEIVLVPGGPPDDVQNAINENHNLLEIISAFASMNGQEKQRWLFSVCTGAGFLGHQGIFVGRTVTTHWDYIETLKEICGDSTGVVRKRWVDAGVSASNVKIITAGGVSCGIDASLWITSKIFNMERALAIADGMDYAWNFGEGLEVTSGFVV